MSFSAVGNNLPVTRGANKSTVVSLWGDRLQVWTCVFQSTCPWRPISVLDRVLLREKVSHRKMKVKSLSRVRLFATPWTVARQAPPCMGFSRQESWSGLPLPSPGDLPDPGIEPGSPALQTDALPSEPLGKPYATVHVKFYNIQNCNNCLGTWKYSKTIRVK